MKFKIFFILFLFPFISCKNFFKKEESFRLIPVSQKNLVKYVEANGSVEPQSTIDIFSPVSGRLEQIFVKEGDMVEAKQKIGLVSSDSRSLFLDIASNKSKKEIAYWKKQLQLTPIISPTSGKIISVKTDLDEKITGAIAQISKGEIIRANVDEADLPDIKLGQKVTVQFDVAPEHKVLGKLEKISQTSKLVNNVNVYQVEVSFPPEDQRKDLMLDVKIGMSVTLNFSVEEKKQVLALPASVLSGQSMTTINLVKENDQKAKVKLGGLYGNWVEVLSGLELGDKVKIPKFTAQDEKIRKSPLMIKKE